MQIAYETWGHLVSLEGTFDNKHPCSFFFSASSLNPFCLACSLAQNVKKDNVILLQQKAQQSTVYPQSNIVVVMVQKIFHQWVPQVFFAFPNLPDPNVLDANVHCMKYQHLAVWVFPQVWHVSVFPRLLALPQSCTGLVGGLTILNPLAM